MVASISASRMTTTRSSAADTGAAVASDRASAAARETNRLDMRRYVIESRQPGSVGRLCQRRRRPAVLLLAALAAAGCRPAHGPDPTANLHTDFAGGVVADEPRAVTVA